MESATLSPRLTRDVKYRGSDVPLGFWRVREHPAYPVHTHDFTELVLVQEGSGVHVTEHGQNRVSAGDVFVIHRDHPHGYRDTDRLHIVNILFDMAELHLPTGDITSLSGYHALFEIEASMRLRRHLPALLNLTPAQMHDITPHVNALEHEFAHRRPGWGFTAIGQFMLIVAKLSRFYSAVDIPGANPALRLGEAISWIESYYRESLSLPDLARIGHMSPRTFTRRFRELKGCSPGEYITRLRIDEAKRLLAGTNQSVTEIAFEVGFGDSNYFARQFRQLVGSSPRAFRQNG